MGRKIGFIGLGIMGTPMSKNLIKEGHELTVCRRGRSKELEQLGAKVVGTCKEVAEKADLVITMLPDSPDVENATLGLGGIFEGIKTGSTYVDMSTISPVTTKKLAQVAMARGVRTLDAPVSGGEKGAVEGSLTIMVGGAKEVFDDSLPIFQALGKNIVYCGGVGSGQVVKACNQVLVAGVLESASEALLLGAKAGVDPEIVLKVIAGGYAMRVLDVRGPLMLKRDFKPGFKTKLHYKDLEIALTAGFECGAPLPVTGLIHEMMGAMKTLGRGEYDHSGIITILEDLAKAEVKKTLSQ
ncbi:MAG: 2-hydroxy-3-oxopropionate reductase [Candidatus Bathyarchaeia archaeon]